MGQVKFCMDKNNVPYDNLLVPGQVQNMYKILLFLHPCYNPVYLFGLMFYIQAKSFSVMMGSFPVFLG